MTPAPGAGGEAGLSAPPASKPHRKKRSRNKNKRKQNASASANPKFAMQNELMKSAQVAW